MSMPSPSSVMIIHFIVIQALWDPLVPLASAAQQALQDPMVSRAPVGPLVYLEARDQGVSLDRPDPRVTEASLDQLEDQV